MEQQALVVDDDPSVRALIRMILEDEGYEVRMARDGADALRQLSRWQPDVMLLDLMMPNMDGWTLCSQMRRDERLRDVPVVILTAVPDADHEAERLGATDVLPKPFDLDALLETVARAAHPH